MLSGGSTECDTTGLDLVDNDYRCITSVGTANGATRRVQAFVVAGRVPMFPIDGLFATGALSIAANQLTGAVGQQHVRERWAPTRAAAARRTP